MRVLLRKFPTVAGAGDRNGDGKPAAEGVRCAATFEPLDALRVSAGDTRASRRYVYFNAVQDKYSFDVGAIAQTLS